jgi:hypothetical protein
MPQLPAAEFHTIPNLKSFTIDNHGQLVTQEDFRCLRSHIDWCSDHGHY